MAKRGRKPTPKPGPDAYSSASYQTFLSRLDQTEGELELLKDDRKEIVNGAKEEGLNPLAHNFVQSLRGKVHKGKLALQDAQATMDAAIAYFEWSGLADQRDMLREQPVKEIAELETTLTPTNPNGNGTGKKAKANGAPKVTKGDAKAAIAAAKEHLGTADDQPPAA